MSDIDPFSQENLDRIFKISAKHPDRLSSRESNDLEFKKSFNFGSLSEYMRTAAGFANANGGYIVYGIAPKPHTLIGLTNGAFDKIDPENITNFFHLYFDPEIVWSQHIHEINGKSFGLLYIHESDSKPVMCKMSSENGKDLREGEIYFRYRGRTQTIRYAELTRLIDERRMKEQRTWINLIKEIARIGVADAALLDLRRGNITGAGGTIVIDESLIPQLAFIREGEFSEIKGTPTLKLIGNVETIRPASMMSTERTKILKTPGILATDIMQSFLNADKVPEPKSYLTQIALESSAYLPCYYYIKQSKITVSQAVDVIQAVVSTSQSKAILLKRLQDNSTLKKPLSSDKNARGQRKLAIRKRLLARTLLPPVADSELSDILDVMHTLNKSDMPITDLRNLLLHIFSTNYGKSNATINDKIRRAICYIDWLYYAKEVSS